MLPDEWMEEVAPQFANGVENGPAYITDDGLYRYALGRQWEERGAMLLFVGLNPSTADASKLDPTMRRVIGFAKSERFKGVWMGNLFALRSTDPRALRFADDPVGPENNLWLQRMAAWCQYVCLGWGGKGVLLSRGEYVARMLESYAPFCLGTTVGGHPRHPLYLKAETPFTRYFETGVQP